VLFLDEAPEFARRALDALRQPLESGVVQVSRASWNVTFPAEVQLVLAANPCPCASPGGDCGCTALARRRYLFRLSGPLLDRIDLHVWLQPVAPDDLLGDPLAAEPTEVVAKRVAEARATAAARLAGTRWRTNAEVPGSELRTRWRLPRSVTAVADQATTACSRSPGRSATWPAAPAPAPRTSPRPSPGAPRPRSDLRIAGRRGEVWQRGQAGGGRAGARGRGSGAPRWSASGSC
jgi:magnesium chelatase family protein